MAAFFQSGAYFPLVELWCVCLGSPLSIILHPLPTTRYKSPYRLVILAGCQYILLSVAAMFIYPGGTRRNAGAEGYIFTRNFLSDLGRTQAFNGESNTVSAVIYAWILVCLGFSNTLLFPALRRKLNLDAPLRKLSSCMAFFGILAGLGFIGVGLAPSDLSYSLHITCVLVAFSSLLIALLLLMAGIYRHPTYPVKYAHALALANIMLFVYVILMFLGPNPHTSDAGLTIQASGQKVIVYTLILSLMYQARGTAR